MQVQKSIKTKISFFIFFLYALTSSAQSSSIGAKFEFDQLKNIGNTVIKLVPISYVRSTSEPNVIDHNISINPYPKVAKFRTTDLPIFCKAEYLIQKRSGINFKFRLGSIDYVDRLEGK